MAAGIISKILQGLLGFRTDAVRGGTASRILGDTASPYAVSSYPTDVPDFDYGVKYIPGPPQNNALLKRGPAQKAARMQTMGEHNRAVNKYVRPGMSPVERRWAIQKGLEEERQLLSFWNEGSPRTAITPSSSAVSGIRINRDNTISVQFGGKGKWYTYEGGPNRFEASLAAKDLVTAPSIGRAINSKTGFWGSTHKLW